MLDVLIIGGGLSGLTAAYRLQQAGRSFRVLEARRRTGGRAYSPVLGGHPVDVGATWVWDNERSVHALITELGLSTFLHADEGLDVLESDVLQKGRFPRSHVASRRVHGGVGAMCQALTERTQQHVQLGTKVCSVHPLDDAIEVTTEAGASFSARWVLGGLPPSLMANLAPNTKHVGLWRDTPVWMGQVAKVVAVFDTPFWRRTGLSGRGFSTKGPMTEVHDLSSPDGKVGRLFGFVHRSSLATGADLQALVQDQFVRMFGRKPASLFITRWWEEPFTTQGRGGQNMDNMGHPLLREPVLGGRLHLIGCETSGVSPGHLNGAIERAEAVVRQIVSET